MMILLNMSEITLYYDSVRLRFKQCYNAWRDEVRRDDRVSRCTLKRANHNRCWAD